MDSELSAWAIMLPVHPNLLSAHQHASASAAWHVHWALITDVSISSSSDHSTATCQRELVDIPLSSRLLVDCFMSFRWLPPHLSRSSLGNSFYLQLARVMCVHQSWVVKHAASLDQRVSWRWLAKALDRFMSAISPGELPVIICWKPRVRHHWWGLANVSSPIDGDGRGGKRVCGIHQTSMPSANNREANIRASAFGHQRERSVPFMSRAHIYWQMFLGLLADISQNQILSAVISGVWGSHLLGGQSLACLPASVVHGWSFGKYTAHARIGTWGIGSGVSSWLIARSRSHGDAAVSWFEIGTA